MKIRVIFCVFRNNKIYYKTFDRKFKVAFDTPLKNKKEVGMGVYTAIIEITSQDTVFKFRKLPNKLACVEAYHVEGNKFYNEKTPEILNYINEVLEAENIVGFTKRELRAIKRYAKEMKKKFASQSSLSIL